MPDSLSLVWGHSVYFAKFPILGFSKRYSFNSVQQISTKLLTKYHNQGLILSICQKLQNYGTLIFFLTQDPMRLEILKRYSQFSSDLNQTL